MILREQTPTTHGLCVWGGGRGGTEQGAGIPHASPEEHDPAPPAYRQPEP